MFNPVQFVGKPYTEIDHVVINRSDTAVAVNDVMAIDFTLSSSSTTGGYSSATDGSGTLGSSTGSSAISGFGPFGEVLAKPDLNWSGIITPLGESDTVLQPYCVVTDLLGGTGAVGTKCKVRLYGRCVAKTASATLAPGAGLMMSATESNRELVAYTAGTTDGQRPIAIVEIGGTSVTSATVFFNGFAGLAVSQATTN